MSRSSAYISEYKRDVADEYRASVGTFAYVTDPVRFAPLGGTAGFEPLAPQRTTFRSSNVYEAAKNYSDVNGDPGTVFACGAWDPYTPGIGNAHLASWGIDRSPDSVTTEDALRSLNHKWSRCPAYQTTPAEFRTLAAHHQVREVPSASGPGRSTLVPIQSRPHGKSNNLAGIFINRFDPLICDPQDLTTISANDAIGMDTRNYAKDAVSTKVAQSVRRFFS